MDRVRKLTSVEGVNRQERQGRQGRAVLREPDTQTDALAHEVIGAAIEVHKALGPGFLEEVYERALHVELRIRGIPFQPQVFRQITYKGVIVGKGTLDLLVGDRLVVELKAVREIAPIHRAITISYLRLTNLQLALLINFNVAKLVDGIQRIVRS